MYGLGSLVTKAARFFPNRMAVADEDGSLSYLELNDMVNRTANYLVSQGFVKGSRMAFLCRITAKSLQLCIWQLRRSE